MAYNKVKEALWVNSMLSLPLNKFLLEQRLSAKMIVASLMVLGIARLFGINYHDMMWSIITVFVAIDARIESTLILSLNRVIGTAIGVTVSALLLWVFAPHSQLGMIGCLVVICLVASQVQLLGKGVRVAGVAAAVVLFMGFTQPNYFQIAWDRFIDISLGVACALIASIMVFPRRNRKAVAKNTAVILADMALCFFDLMNTSADASLMAQKLGAIKSQLEKNRSLLQEIKLAHGKSIMEVTLLNYLADVLEEVYVHLKAIHEPDQREVQTKIKMALSEELKLGKNVLNALLEQFRRIIKHDGYDKAALSLAKTEVKQAEEKINVRFIAGRENREFKAYSDTEILAAYTFLYHVKSILQALRLSAGHVAKLAEIYYR